MFAGQVDPALCFVSEKYDGVPALWDGSTLRHGSGRAVTAPPFFLAALPREPLEGELWLGRGRFEPLSTLVRRSEPRDGHWQGVRGPSAALFKLKPYPMRKRSSSATSRVPESTTAWSVRARSSRRRVGAS